MPPRNDDPLTGAPFTLGATADCDVRLPAGGANQARVRIWRRDGNHTTCLSPPATVTIGGRPISWATLEDGDVIVIGTNVIAFHLIDGH